MRPLTDKQARNLGIEPPKPKRRRKSKAEIEQERRLFVATARAHGLPEPIPEFKFHPTRKWLIDYAWPNESSDGVQGVALEIEGGAFRGPGHRSVGVFLRNIEKYNEAAILGWILIRVTTDQVKSGECFGLVRRALGLNR